MVQGHDYNLRSSAARAADKHAAGTLPSTTSAGRPPTPSSSGTPEPVRNPYGHPRGPPQQPKGPYRYSFVRQRVSAGRFCGIRTRRIYQIPTAFRPYRRRGWMPWVSGRDRCWCRAARRSRRKTRSWRRLALMSRQRLTRHRHRSVRRRWWPRSASASASPSRWEPVAGARHVAHHRGRPACRARR